MSNKEKNKRRIDRLKLQIPIRVEGREDKDVSWNEITRLRNVSALGAGFLLKHSVAEGRLLYLTMPLPLQLRRFDFSEQQYCVWSLVRYCRPAPGEDSPAFDTGVAFIGKTPPLSYKENPLTVYSISRLGEAGFWEVFEDRRAPVSRRQPRYAIPLNISLALCDEQENIIAHEHTVTENISLGGAAVFSSLPVKVGDSVKIICEQYNTSLVAEVRNLRQGPDGMPRLHLQFVDAQFPLQGIEQL